MGNRNSVASPASGQTRDSANLGSPAALDASKLSMTLAKTLKPLQPIETLRFGQSFSDHMIVATYDPELGWSAPEVKPYGPITLDPQCSCFQYGGNVFEGMKAYLGPDGKARLFRPDMNMRRMEKSCARLALPPIDGDVVLELIKRLVNVERRWIPKESGYSLYIRPTVIATRPGLGVTASDHAILYILASPTGPYFAKPVSLLAVSENVRAWPGGTGGHKVAGNYSPGFLPQRAAAEKGYDQILWLFGEDRRVTEAGAMNFFVVVKRDDEDGVDLITAPLDGTILPGVTRASCLALASDPEFHKEISVRLHPQEMVYTMSDLAKWSSEGKLLEALVIGTAVIVGPCNRIGYEGKDIVIPGDGMGPVGTAIRKKILDIQEGRTEWKGWGVVCA
ncbi:aminotransferase [Suillus fuscotomentosus]|uniref:Branched-chain-amino-acid aminotransferase n=1 Tax=Suillus fuscotomentosus TaxID=1912939 RepID=A0AAD4EQJ9_9AGAM|nr:aminotransferase [Suillus fuscotomentosus]KAG1908748.1 aminotransferase [Suillus fuscotomentosus]